MGPKPDGPSPRLLEANEQLVLALVRAQSDAEATARLLAEATRTSHSDALTGLPNRTLFLDRVEQALASARRHDARLAILFLDLDRFKEINDRLGHAAGDQALAQVAQVLVATVREADTVSRYGGDEFVVLLTEIKNAEDALLIARKLITAIGTPQELSSEKVAVTASVGISIYPEDGLDPQTLINNADTAMFRAKRRRAGLAVRYGVDDASETELGRKASDPSLKGSTGHALLLSEGERLNEQLRSANEHLMLALLNAQTAQAATESSRPFRALIDHMDDGAITLDPSGVVSFCSERFAEMVRVASRDVEGTMFTRFLDEPSEREAFERLLAQVPFTVVPKHFVLSSVDGARISVGISLIDVQPDHADRSGRVICGIVTALEVGPARSQESSTLNRRLISAVNARSRTEDHLQLALEAAGMGSWELNLDTFTVWCTKRSDSILGREGLLAPATLSDMIAQVMPEDRLALEQAFESAMLSGELDIESKIRRADNSEIRLVQFKARAFHHFGLPTRFAGVVTDVTERRVVQDQLRQAQKMEAVGQLTGGIAHDFNNLLLVIGANLDLLARRVAPSTPPVRLLLESARRGVERGGRLNQQLLAFSRRQELDPEVLCIRDLLPRFADLAIRATDSTVTVQVNELTDPWLCETDINQLEIAVLNLAINARDAMLGGGTLKLAAKNVDVNALTALSWGGSIGEHVVVSVKDTGTGMTQEVIAHAFEPFFTTKAVGKGTGLGLSQVYGFVKQSGGFISIESELGRGTEISIYLPRSLKTQTAPPATAPAPAPVALAGRVVLVVDDDDEVRQASSAMLRDLGYTVFEAPNGAAALALLDHGTEVDLVFSDVVMHGSMSGIGLAVALAARQPLLRVVLTSGYTGRRMNNETLPEGVPVLVKPYSQHALAQVVATALNERPKQHRR